VQGKDLGRKKKEMEGGRGGDRGYLHDIILQSEYIYQ